MALECNLTVLGAVGCLSKSLLAGVDVSESLIFTFTISSVFKVSAF